MNILNKILGDFQDKQKFRTYRKRSKALPEEYRIIFNEIEAYIWNFAMDGMIDVLSDVITFFETSAAEGKYVLEIIGNDVVKFCDDLLQEWESRTWQGKIREKFNKRIYKKLKKIKCKQN